MNRKPDTEKHLTDPVCDMTVSPDAEYSYLHVAPDLQS